MQEQGTTFFTAQRAQAAPGNKIGDARGQRGGVRVRCSFGPIHQSYPLGKSQKNDGVSIELSLLL